MTESTAPGPLPRRFRYLRDPVFLAAVGIYLGNRFVVRPATADPGDFFHCYVSDLLCIPFWVPPTLWVARGLGLRKHDAPPTLGELTLFLLVWSWLFEVIAPSPFLQREFPKTTGDWRDIVAYAVGTLVAVLLWRSRRAPPRDVVVARRTRVHVGAAAAIALLTAAGSVIPVLGDARGEDWRRESVREGLKQVAEQIESFRSDHDHLPASLDELPSPRPPFNWARLYLPIYRPSGQSYSLVDLGADRESGGHGDNADIYWPPSLQPPEPWYEYWMTRDGRDAASVATMLGFLLASAWLLWRWKVKAFAPLRWSDLAVTAIGVGVAVAAGVFILLTQNALAGPPVH